MHELADLIVGKYDGSLKAEHGTGRNMAPWVEQEWGAKATELMWRIKALADPDGILGPGVVLNRNPKVHLEHLKSQPAIEEVATKCIECGICEPVCPSRWLTSRRASASCCGARWRARRAGSPVREALVREYEYDGVETCAADGSCALACPVGIDTGALVKGFRAEQHGAGAERIALDIARRYAGVERRARVALKAPSALGAARPARPPAAWSRDELVPRGRTPCRRPPPAACPRPAARAPRPSTSRPASTASSGRPTAGARCPRPWSRLGAGRPAAVDPRRRLRPLLRDAVDLQGLRRGRPLHGGEDSTRRWPAGPTAAGCPS